MRHKAPGKLTNYEMEVLRDEGSWRYRDGKRVRWAIMWASVSSNFHPRSQAEWDAHIDDEDDE